MSRNLASSAELQQKVRTVLLKEWDPIGIKDIAEAQDEYDIYLPKICKMIAIRTPFEKISDYLMWIENQRMGLCPRNKQYVQEAAKKLATLV